MINKLNKNTKTCLNHPKDTRRYRYPNVKSLAEHFSRLSTKEDGLLHRSLKQSRHPSRRKLNTSPVNIENSSYYRVQDGRSVLTSVAENLDEHEIECFNKDFSYISLERLNASFIQTYLGNSLSSLSISDDKTSPAGQDENLPCNKNLVQADESFLQSQKESFHGDFDSTGEESNSSFISDSTGSTIIYVSCKVDHDDSEDMDTLENVQQSNISDNLTGNGHLNNSQCQLLHPDWRKVPWKQYFGWTDAHQSLYEHLLQQGQGVQRIYFDNPEEYENAKNSWGGSGGVPFLRGPNVSSVSEMLRVINSLRAHGSGSV